MSFISREQRENLLQTALRGGLADPQYRTSLLDGIDLSAAGFIPVVGVPNLQLAIDLRWVAENERISNGVAPLLIWLKNAARLRRGFADGAAFQRWADAVSSIAGGEPEVAITAHPAGAPGAPQVTVGLKTFSLPELKEAILFGYEQFLPVHFLEQGMRTVPSIVHLSVPKYEQGTAAQTSSGSEVVFNGTGWLLGEQHVMTNHHVVNARNQGTADAAEADFRLQGAHTRVRFDYDDRNSRGSEVTALAVVAWDRELDYAVLEISAGQGRPPLTRRPGRFQKADDHVSVNIIQHPDGGTKVLAMRNNYVARTTDTDVCYFTDTKRGSSGSPVFDDQWRVVALHRGSVDAGNQKYFGEAPLYVNIGTQMASIEEDLRTRFPAVPLT